MKMFGKFHEYHFFNFLFSLPVYKIFHVLCDKELDHFLFNFVLFANVVCSTIKRVVQRNLFCHYCTNRKVTFFLLFIVVANTSQPGNVDLRIFAEFNGIRGGRKGASLSVFCHFNGEIKTRTFKQFFLMLV